MARYHEKSKYAIYYIYHVPLENTVTLLHKKSLNLYHEQVMRDYSYNS